MFELLDLAFKDNSNEPTNLEYTYYLFFDKGIGLEQFNEYPIPYILSMIRTTKYIRQKETESLGKK